MRKLKLPVAEVIACIGAGAVAFLLKSVYVCGSGGISAVLASVNFSVWEQMKAVIFGCVFASVIEYFCIKTEFKKYLCSKAIALFSSAILFICVVFILYGIIGDITDSIINAAVVLSVAAGFFASYCALKADIKENILFFPALLAVILLLVCLLCFTPNPPEIGLFKDLNDGSFGLEYTRSC